MVIEALL